MEILEHQREAHSELVSRARAFFLGGWIGLPLKPRWASLICGPTGTGKTTVAAMAAATLSRSTERGTGIGPVSLIRVAAPNWMPCGAHHRGTRETVSVIAEHVAHHDRTILCIDEIDKTVGGIGGIAGVGGGGDAWQSYVRAEVYDLLDGRWPTGLQAPEGPEDEHGSTSEVPIAELTRRLEQNVFIVGVGTFQSWFDSTQSRRSMGFGADISPAHDDITADIIAERMPRELANRFHSGIIRLPEFVEADYQRIAREAERKLPERLRKSFAAEVARRLPSAIAAKKGVRFLEEALVEVLKVGPEMTLAESILMDGI